MRDDEPTWRKSGCGTHLLAGLLVVVMFVVMAWEVAGLPGMAGP